MVSLGIIGYGHFGAFMHRMAERFFPEADLRIYARKRVSEGGVFTELGAVLDCDAILLCVPIGAYEETLLDIQGRLRPETVLIDVATVKRYTSALIRKILPGQPHLCTHPMFGPESYTKQGGDVTGLRVVITESNLPLERFAPIRDYLSREGFDIVEKTADEHDRELAETLFLTHYVGQVIARGGFERTEIDTVSFGFLMDAVDSVRHDSRLFEEVFRFNPYCRDVVQRFDDVEQQVRQRLMAVDPAPEGYGLD